MTDITANVVVSMPSQLFTMARSFKAVANGKIYIGKIDTDPVNPENQIQVYVENEDGSHVPVSQPIIINAAGYPVYNGQIAKFVTVQGHSMAVYDAYGAQQFYFPNVLKYDPDQFSKTLASSSGASMVGTNEGGNVQEYLDSLEENISVLKMANLIPLPIRYSNEHSYNMDLGVNPQALAEDKNYWYITEDVTTTPGDYLCRISRINKSDGSKKTATGTVKCHGQGIGVLFDGRVFVGGSSNSKISIVDFVNDTINEQDCVGLYKDFPFCFAADENIIYQLQDNDSTSANITRLAVLDFHDGFKSDFSIDRQIVKAGYPQGIATDGRYIFISCGDSWSASTGGQWNDYWTLFRTTIGGVVIDRAAFRRSSMGELIGVTATQHEPQGISYFDGKISLMQYIGDSSATKCVIFKQDASGIWLRSIPKNRYVTYNGLDEIGINISSLTKGKSISTIVKNMVDGSTINFSISGETAITEDTGIGGFGTCSITKINNFRAYALTVESSSELSPEISPMVSFVGVYNDVQSGAKMVSGSRKSLLSVYASNDILTKKTINVPYILTCCNLILHCTNDSSANPLGVNKFFREEIDEYIKSNIVLIIESPDSNIMASVKFTSTGIVVNSVTGAFILKNIYVS